MKIDFISDIHADFYIKDKNPVSEKSIKVMKEFVKNRILPADGLSNLGEVLILAGDLGHYNQQTKILLEILKEYYDNIIVVFGNHDLYLVSNNQQKKYNYNSQFRIDELKEICISIGVHYLEDVITINGIRFGGTGSWYNVRDVKHWKQSMNENSYIYSEESYYGGVYNYKKHKTTWHSQIFREAELKKLKNIAHKKCDIFITHVAMNQPTLEEGMDPQYEDDPNNDYYYTNDIDLLLESKARVHIHGHTHQPLDYTKEGIRILCNPFGYPEDENAAIIKQITI